MADAPVKGHCPAATQQEQSQAEVCRHANCYLKGSAALIGAAFWAVLTLTSFRSERATRKLTPATLCQTLTDETPGRTAAICRILEGVWRSLPGAACRLCSATLGSRAR